MAKTLGEFLQEEMALRQMSARQFAEFVDVAPSTITRAMDFNAPPEPSLGFLRQLARATGRDLCSLVALVAPGETTINPETLLLAQRISELPVEQLEFIDNFILGASLKLKQK